MLPAGLSYGACTNRAFLIGAALGCESVHRRDSDSRYQVVNGETVFPIHHELTSLGRRAADAAHGVTENALDRAARGQAGRHGGQLLRGRAVRGHRRDPPDRPRRLLRRGQPVGTRRLVRTRRRGNSSTSPSAGAGTEPFVRDHSTLALVDPMRVDMCNISFPRGARTRAAAARHRHDRQRLLPHPPGPRRHAARCAAQPEHRELLHRRAQNRPGLHGVPDAVTSSSSCRCSTSTSSTTGWPRPARRCSTTGIRCARPSIARTRAGEHPAGPGRERPAAGHPRPRLPETGRQVRRVRRPPGARGANGCSTRPGSDIEDFALLIEAWEPLVQREHGHRPSTRCTGSRADDRP